MTEGGRSVRKLLLYLLAGAASFAAGVVIFYTIIMPQLMGRRDVTLVPDLKGQSVRMAERRCSNSGFEFVVVGERHSSDIPEGYVIEQNPGPADGLKLGRAIRVTVSAGRKMETVPELRNKSLRQAELLLESQGLGKDRVVRIYSHDAGENAVIASSPPVGTSVPHGSRVDVLLAMRGEPRTYRMPLLVGKDLLFVKERLERMGFEVTRVVSRRDASRFPNTILDQQPSAGTKIEEGGTIELVVSTVE